MSAIVTSTVVERSADEVFAYATDPTRFVEWQGGVTGGHMDSTGEPQVGDVCVTTRRIGGAERPASSRLVTFDPPRAWAVRGTDGPIRALVDLTVVPLTEDRSRLTISVDFEGHGIGMILVPLMVRREARKEMPANLATLKARLEA
ncbi:MAG TPA: SRPBCC family protein [Lapillicoccus sp.]|nr:SRPBCC family protein [Lapillicoccus sp.]